MWEAGAPKSNQTHYRAPNVVGNDIKPVTRLIHESTASLSCI